MTSTVPSVGELSEPSALDALLHPRSVAVIGASRNPAALGGRPLGFMASYGFPGKVYPVNASAPEVQGRPAYASIADVPGPVDLALVMVRAELVAQVLLDCAAAGVRVAVVMSSGFGEGTGAGAGILEGIAPLLAASGMRILGPNCEGLASLAAAAPLTFSPVLDIGASGTRLRPGNIAVLSQSGGLGFAVAQWGTEAGLDFSYIISTGNEFDLHALELAGHLVHSPRTDIVVMLVEGLRDLAEFAHVAERFRQAGKRLVVAKLGRTEPGARGAYAHTRHAAGDAGEYARLFRSCGVLTASDMEELIDVVQAVAKVRRRAVRQSPAARALPAAGARIGIATTSGGAGVWLADACAERGLLVPELSAPVQAALREHMPPFGSPVNPVDLTAQLIAGGTVVPALRALAASGEVDAVVLVTSLASAERLERDKGALAELAGECAVPLLVFSYTRPAPSGVAILTELGVPWYTSAVRAARGLAALAGDPDQ
jgi:acyl-CoA synthetase (NDP forming)